MGWDRIRVGMGRVGGGGGGGGWGWHAVYHVLYMSGSVSKRGCLSYLSSTITVPRGYPATFTSSFPKIV